MKKHTVVIVGGETLLAREIRDVLSQRAPEIGARLVGMEVDSAILTERAGEPVVVGLLDESNFVSARVAFLAGSAESGRQTLEITRRMPARPAVIDLTFAVQDDPEASLRAPLIESPGAISGPGHVHVIAHPAAIILAAFLARLHAAHPVARSIVHVFEPASERGKDGIDELQQQTVNLFSFRSLPQQVFDAQLSFNLLPRYGTEARECLEVIEGRIRAHLATLLARAGAVPMPSLRLVQAPVFHGYSISLWVEFKSRHKLPALIKSLASEQIEIRAAGEEPPTNVGAGGQSGMTVGAIELDPNDPRAAWFWIVADNHRVLAENAVCLARLIIPAEGTA